MRRSDRPGARLRQSHPSQIRDAAGQRMMDKDGLRRDSLREGLKTKGRSRREASARHAEAEKGGRRPRRNDILPSLQIVPCPVDALKSHVRKLRKSDPAHVREIANSISTLGFNVPLLAKTMSWSMAIRGWKPPNCLACLRCRAF